MSSLLLTEIYSHHKSYFVRLANVCVLDPDSGGAAVAGAGNEGCDFLLHDPEVTWEMVKVGWGHCAERLPGV